MSGSTWIKNSWLVLMMHDDSWWSTVDAGCRFSKVKSSAGRWTAWLFLKTYHENTSKSWGCKAAAEAWRSGGICFRWDPGQKFRKLRVLMGRCCGSSWSYWFALSCFAIWWDAGLPANCHCVSIFSSPKYSTVQMYIHLFMLATCIHLKSFLQFAAQFVLLRQKSLLSFPYAGTAAKEKLELNLW